MLKRSAGSRRTARRSFRAWRHPYDIDALLFAAPLFSQPATSSGFRRDTSETHRGLGSTWLDRGAGALAVVDAYPDRLHVVGLAAGENMDLLAAQIARYRPRVVAVGSSAAVDRLRQSGVAGDVAGTGRDGLVAVASHPDVDIVLCASAGTDGLETYAPAALTTPEDGRAGEQGSLVIAGGLVTDLARQQGVAMPVDSEHNAVHRCVHGRRLSDIQPADPYGKPDLPRPSGVKWHTSPPPMRSTSRPWRRIDPEDPHHSTGSDEQGARGDRSAPLVVWRALRADRRARAPAVGRSLAGGADRWIDDYTGAGRDAMLRLPIQCAFSYPDRWGPLLRRWIWLASASSISPFQTAPAFPCLGLAYQALEVEHAAGRVERGQQWRSRCFWKAGSDSGPFHR